MKNTLFFLFIIVNQLIYSQGNLEFSQVISSTISISGPLSGTFGTIKESTQTITVPVGKIYKIESIKVFHNPWSSACGSEDASEVEGLVKLNGTIFIGQQYINTVNGYIADGFNTSEELIKNAIWIKGGDVLTFAVRSSIGNSGCNSSTPLTGTSNFFISALEFTP